MKRIWVTSLRSSLVSNSEVNGAYRAVKMSDQSVIFLQVADVQSESESVSELSVSSREHLFNMQVI